MLALLVALALLAAVVLFLYKKGSAARKPALVVPGAIRLSDAQPGCVVGFETRNAFGFFIGVGEALAHFRWPRIHHIAVLTEFLGGDKSDPKNWLAVQAARRVDEVPLDTIGLQFVVMPLPAGVDYKKVVAQARAFIREEYGVLSIISIALGLLTPRFVPMVSFRSRNEPNLICSALGALAVHCGGWTHVWQDFYQVFPDELVQAMSDALTTE